MPKDATTLYALSTRFYRLYRPYFSLRGKYAWHTLWLAGIVVGNILLAFALAFVNISMRSLVGLLVVPGVSYTTFFFAAAQCIAAIVGYGAITGLDARMASMLGSALSHAMNKALETRWLHSQAYYGATLLPDKSIKNPATLISHDIHEMNRQTMELLDNFLTTVSNFAVGIVGLYALSVPLEITIFSTLWTIPGYLVLGTVLYALAYNTVTQYIGKSLEKLELKQRNTELDAQTKIHHIRSHAESIAFKKGATYEHRSLVDTLKQNKYVQSATSKIRSLLSFATNLHAEFTSFFAILLCAPNIIAKKLEFSSVLEIPYHFQNVVNMFTWKSDNFDTLAECAVTLKQVEKCNVTLTQWESLQQKNAANLTFSFTPSPTLTIEQLTINKSDGSPILQNFTRSIPKGKITLLHGPSGIGKTSLLRAVAGLSPYASGAIHGFSKNTHFIPSQFYCPVNGSLLDAILYPRQEKATPEEILLIKNIMHELGLKQSIIDDLLIVKNWNGPYLSDGEKQRIEIISAIIKKPDLLFMDEATSRVDHDVHTNNKGKIEQVLKQYLPHTTILYTDHNPSPAGTFYDHKISI